jgi:hypothetical protein
VTEFSSSGLSEGSQLTDAFGEYSISATVSSGGSGKIGHRGGSGLALVFRDNLLVVILIIADFLVL